MISLQTHLVEKTPPTKGKPEISPVDPCLTILRQISVPLRNWTMVTMVATVAIESLYSCSAILCFCQGRKDIR